MICRLHPQSEGLEGKPDDMAADMCAVVGSDGHKAHCGTADSRKPSTAFKQFPLSYILLSHSQGSRRHSLKQ